MDSRERKIYRVTVLGSVVNLLLVALKFAFGIMGRSSAMIADAVHSLSDLVTDVVVIVFVKLSNKPQDRDHNYGHGKYETLATAFIGLALFAVGIMILYGGVEKIAAAMRGKALEQPGMIAFWAAVISIVSKEWCYRFTVRVGRQVGSQAVVANAWHHRSDALSSIGTLTGIGLAYFLGDKWRIADPLAALVVSVFIFKIAFDLLRSGLGELLEHALPAATEQEILNILTHSKEVTEPHHLRTRRIGATVAIEAHIRVDPRMSVLRSHQLTVDIERQLKERFGPNTLISIHVEPIETEKLSSSDSEKDKNI